MTLQRLLSKQFVCIIGGGPVGLTLGLTLDRCGIPSVIVDEAPGPPTHPQAHFINTRTMEIFDTLSPRLPKQIGALTPPRELWKRFMYCTKLVGGTHLGDIDHFQDYEMHSKHSAQSVVHLPQTKLIPLLVEEVQRSQHCKLIYGAKATHMVPNNSASVTVTVQTHADQTCTELSNTIAEITGEPATAQLAQNTTRLQCPWLVAADGANSVLRKLLPVNQQGRKGMQSLMNVYFECKELHNFINNQSPAMLYFVFNSDVVCVLVAHNILEGEWVCQIPFFPPGQDASQFTETICKQLIRKALGLTQEQLPESSLRIKSIRPWTMSAVVADKWAHAIHVSPQVGVPESGDHTPNPVKRVFLVGDAAHQFPPAGGFGMNTGIGDAHNLGWKLAAVISGAGKPKLLDSYETERKLIAEYTSELSQENFNNVLKVAKSLGLNDRVLGFAGALIENLVPGQALKKAVWENMLWLGKKPLAAISAPHALTDILIYRTRKLIEASGLALLYPGQDLGYTYPVPDVCKDSGYDADHSATKDNKEAFAISSPHPHVYIPSPYPGHRLPHVWFRTPDADEPVSSLSLPGSVNGCELWLFCCEQGRQEWLEAAKQAVNTISAAGLQLTIVVCYVVESVTAMQQLQLLPSDGPVVERVVADARSEAAESWQFRGSAAILVRPDGHVWWRGGSPQCAELPAVIEALLC